MSDKVYDVSFQAMLSDTTPLLRGLYEESAEDKGAFNNYTTGQMHGLPLT